MGQMQSPTQQVDAVVVGAGIAGMYQLYRLREKGLKVRLFEAGEGVGGTWYWNRYPGARVDSASHVYQYWFSDEILKEWNWSERFPAQEETERYLNFVADKCDLRKDITFKARVASATFDETAKRWTVVTESGETLSTQFLVMCAGGISAPLVPPFPGHEKFKGQIVHTARWPKAGIELTGKRVGVIGTGATGMQVIQTIASQVKQLTVFQRTANYAIPMRNPKYGDADRAEFRAQYPALKQRVQRTFAGFDYDLQESNFVDLSPEERQKTMETLWKDGSLSFWIGGFKEVFFDAGINEEVSKFVRERMRARIEDPKMAAKLIPNDHGFGTRRVPLETGYLEAYNRDNVELIDLKADPIECLTEKGLKTRSGEHELDILIFATGFDAGTGALTRVDIRGRDGLRLKDEWSKNIRTTMGLQVHGYPNMFTTMAPFAPAAAFCNVPTCLQQQVDWIADCIQYVREHHLATIEPTAETEAKWLAHHDEVASMTLVAKTKSWYMGSNIEGKQPRLLSYIGGVGAYRQICEDVKAKGYEGFAIA